MKIKYKEFQPIVALVRFLDSHPSNDNGHIVGLHIEEACKTCHLQRDLVLEILYFLQDKEQLTYMVTDGVCDITMKKRN